MRVSQLMKYLAVSSGPVQSQNFFSDAGTYVLRHDDLYLLFNSECSAETDGPSHRHNDALSIEVSVGGRAFIVDPGSLRLHRRFTPATSLSLDRLSFDNSDRWCRTEHDH